MIKNMTFLHINAHYTGRQPVQNVILVLDCAVDSFIVIFLLRSCG